MIPNGNVFYNLSIQSPWHSQSQSTNHMGMTYADALPLRQIEEVSNVAATRSEFFPAT